MPERRVNAKPETAAGCRRDAGSHLKAATRRFATQGYERLLGSVRSPRTPA